MNGLVLASQSASRADLLTRAGVEFETVPSGVDEAPLKAAALAKGAEPRAIAGLLAERKAVSVSLGRSELTLGCDQTLEFAGRLYDKVESRAEARVRLRLLSGARHELHSAAAFAREGKVVWRVLRSARLVMRELSERFIDRYLDQHGHGVVGSSGCYLLEGPGAQLFDDLEGDYFTVLGLPLLPILGFLRTEGLLAA